MLLWKQEIPCLVDVEIEKKTQHGENVFLVNHWSINDKDLKCLIYLGYWTTKHWIYLVFKKDAKADINLVELKFAKLSR